MTNTSILKAATFLVGGILAATGAVLAQVPEDYVERGASLPCLDEVYTLRVHVIAPSPSDPDTEFRPASFDSMVALANAAFSPICVGFEVCEVLDLENYRYAADSVERRRERRALYTDPRRIDVFVTFAAGAEPYGQATFLGIGQLDTAYIDIPRNRVFGTSKALVHELGHYFGLYDTFESDAFGEERVLRTNCEIAGDLVCDTPADPYDPDDSFREPQDYVARNNPCRFASSDRDAVGQAYVAHTANAMSYYADECYCGLTAGQLRRVAAAIEAVERGVF